QNWALNAGGMITRKVNGLADEFLWEERIYEFDHDPGSFWDPPQRYPYGYNYNYNQLNTTSWNTSAKVKSLAEGLWKDSNINGVGTWVDTEPDEFIFNFNGYTGKFYFNESGGIE